MSLFAILLAFVFSSANAISNEGLADKNDIKQVEKCISKYDNDPDTVDKIATNCTGKIREQCEKKFGDVQQSLNACAKLELSIWDEILQKKYKSLVESSSGNDSERLKKAQNEWSAYRQSQCEWEAGKYEGGSISPLIFSLCKYDEAAKRIVNIIKVDAPWQ